MPKVIQVPAALTIQTAQSCYDHWQSELEGNTNITLDFSQVERLDTAGLQLMLYWVKHGGVTYCNVTNDAIQPHLDRFNLTSLIATVVEK